MQRSPCHALSLLTVFCGLLFGEPAQATVWRFLQDSFLYNMSSEDVASFRATVRATLDDAPDAQVINWTSPDGRRVGRIFPRFSYESGGTLCRRTLFRVAIRGQRPETYRFDLCQQEEGWEVVAGPASLSGEDRRNATQFLHQALTHQETGHPITWTGLESGHSATVVPLNDPVLEAPGCRMAAISLIDRDGRSISGRYRFCTTDDGSWTYAPEVAMEAVEPAA